MADENTEFCAIDNRPCSGKCREQSRLVEKIKVFDKATKDFVEQDRMCPALMGFKDLPPKQQRKLMSIQSQQKQEESEEE